MLTEREVTPRMAEANRQNAQKSTGPRTPQGKQHVAYNAVKHGFSAQPTLNFMLAAGEDPAEYQQVRAGLKQSHHPFTPAQEMLVDDLSMLRWVRFRNLRAQAGAITFEMEQLDITRQELQKQYKRDGMSFNRAEVEEKGLINMPDCPVKFEQILKFLGVLMDQVNNKEFKVDVSPTLNLLYGNQPSLRGNYFYRCFGDYLTHKPKPLEYEQLLGAVIDEKKEWTEKYMTFIRRHVEISPARRNLCFAPTEPKWTLILRQAAHIDTQYERKTRLLWEMQDRDWKRRQDPEWQQFIRELSEEEAAEAGDAEAQQAQAEAPSSEILEQSRHVVEAKGSVPENKAVEQGPGPVEEGPADESGLGMAGSGAGESTSDPGTGARGPTEEPQKP